MWWMQFIINNSVLIPLLLGVYFFRKDSLKMTKSLCEFASVNEIFVNFLISKIKRKNFQEIFKEIEDFIGNANHREEMLLKKYINKYKNLNSELLPLDTWYPFSYESQAIRIVLYIIQIIGILQTSLGIIMDLMLSIIFFYTAVQIELIEYKVNEAKSKTQLIKCVQSYQKLKIFINKMKNSIQLLILKTNVGMVFVIINAALQLLQQESIGSSTAFVSMLIAGCVRVYITAQPAQDLYESGQNLAERTFQISMLQNSVSNAKIGFMLAIHCRQPIVISVPGLIKAYTLQYYAGFLSTSVSYFVNLRTALDR
ncbi:PREDICTED: uncharacterized protein LOC105359969 [Ceratosolen solmsi marchali]|uniref:Uncharacterized protein LOC105359969 n=1 Tax=Ceratosolen solmsi marchali TaxID=326594 RepID=A0AAJ6VLQ2_9HYME|nr:PREDICTED: uncharacterized protein LOC105359969 [Ceratosolen solmsi marchali]